MHEKILNFILLNTMHMVMIHLILLWVFLTLNHFYSLYTTPASWWWCLMILLWTTFCCPCFLVHPISCLLLSHQGALVSIICSKCITHLWIFLLLPPGHPSISHLCTFPWSPAKNQVTSYFLPSNAAYLR